MSGRRSALLHSDWFVRGVPFATILLVWELAGRQNPIIASYPSAIVAAFFELVAENRLIPAFAQTLTGLAVGVAIALVLGNLIGFAMGRVRVIEIILDPYVSALYSIPRIALVPLLVLWVGIGFELRVTVVVLSSIFPIIINTYVGSKNIDTDLVDTGRAFAASRFQMLRTIVIPAALPFVFVGLRLGVARGLIGVIVAELSGAVTGTGGLILTFARTFSTDRVFVPVLLLGVLGLVLGQLVYQAQLRAFPWRRQQQGTSRP